MNKFYTYLVKVVHLDGHESYHAYEKLSLAKASQQGWQEGGFKATICEMYISLDGLNELIVEDMD